MRLSRASCGRRARAFDGRFRNAPLCSVHFLFSVDSRWIRGRKRAVVPSLLAFLVVTEIFCRFRKGTRNAWTRRLTNAFSSFSRVRTPTVIFRWPFCQGTFSRRFYLRRRLSLGRLEVCALFLFFFSLFFPPQKRKRRTDNARLRYRSSDDVLRLILIPLPRLTLSPSLSLFSSANNSNASRKKSPLAKTKRRPECPRSSKRLA